MTAAANRSPSPPPQTPQMAAFESCGDDPEANTCFDNPSSSAILQLYHSRCVVARVGRLTSRISCPYPARPLYLCYDHVVGFGVEATAP